MATSASATPSDNNACINQESESQEPDDRDPEEDLDTEDEEPEEDEYDYAMRMIRENQRSTEVLREICQGHRETLASHRNL